jgi:D-inositol-3-phosphate glycosyltransferase
MAELRRIAMVSMHSSPTAQPGTSDSGGMNVSIVSTALELARRGVEVELLTRANGEPRVTEIAAGVTVHELPAGPAGRIVKERFADVADEFGEAVALLSGRADSRYDLVHAHYWLSGIATLPVAIELDIPFAQSFHTLGAMKNLHRSEGDLPESQGRLRAESYLANQADAIVASSATEVASLIDDVGAPAERTWVVRPGVDGSLFTPTRISSEDSVRRSLKIENDRPILVVVGRIQPHKGADLAIRALAELRNEQPVLVIVGEPTPGAERYRASLPRLASELGLAEAVRFPGALDRDDLANLLAVASISVMPSRSETFGLVALESAASGTPVIASDTVGATGSVAPGVSGELVATRHPGEWATMISTLLGDPPRLEALSRSARVYAEGFTWGATAEGLLGVYRQLLADREED